MDEITSKLLEDEKELAVLKVRLGMLDKAMKRIEVEMADDYVNDLRENKSYAAYHPDIRIEKIRDILGLPESEEARSIIDDYMAEKEQEEHHKVVMVNMKEE